MPPRQCGRLEPKTHAGISITTGSGHAVLSAALGLAIALVGVFFSTLISFFLSKVIGAMMLAAGLIIGLRAVLDKKKREITPEEKLLGKTRNKGAKLRGVNYFAVLGAALSPDVSIAPIFLASIPVGLLLALYLFVIFVVASVLSKVVLVQAGLRGLARAFEKVPEKYNDAIVGFVIAAIGSYIILAG